MAVRSTILLLVLSATALAGPKATQKDLKKDPKWLQEVRESIDKGVAWLLEKQSSSGRFPAFEDPRGEVYELGMHCLALLAVIKGGHPMDSREMRKADQTFRRLYKKHQYTLKTYEAGLALMVLQAKDDPETYDPKKKKKKKRKSLLTDEDREIATALSFWIQKKQTAGGMWRYPEDGMDLSNTQYAILGLWSAQRMGLEVDKGVTRRMLNTVLSRQQRDGPKVPRLARSTDPRYGTWRRIGMKDRARGWRYMPDTDLKQADGTRKKLHYPFSGSMTTAGIAVLAIGRDLLGKKDPWLTPQRDRKIRTGVYDGLAWLANNWDVQDNPGQPGNWPFYYLYGLERAARLTGVENIGPHDWYVEGAIRIMSDQRKDGSWPKTQRMRPPRDANVRWWSDQVDTAFAILFLVQSTPELDIPAPVVSGGD